MDLYSIVIHSMNNDQVTPMNLRSIDLNLLVALEALLSERHVTKAADRIGLSQPAMSNALGRLRALFGDELLVRTATGMKPHRAPRSWPNRCVSFFAGSSASWRAIPGSTPQRRSGSS